jgi:hypothetical protein
MDFIVHQECAKMNFMNMQGRANMDQKVQQKLQRERKHMDYKGTLEQVCRKGRWWNIVRWSIHRYILLFSFFIFSPTYVASPYRNNVISICPNNLSHILPR